MAWAVQGGKAIINSLDGSITNKSHVIYVCAACVFTILLSSCSYEHFHYAFTIIISDTHPHTYTHIHMSSLTNHACFDIHMEHVNGTDKHTHKHSRRHSDTETSKAWLLLAQILVPPLKAPQHTLIIHSNYQPHIFAGYFHTLIYIFQFTTLQIK